MGGEEVYFSCVCVCVVYRAFYFYFLFILSKTSAVESIIFVVKTYITYISKNKYNCCKDFK